VRWRDGTTVRLYVQPRLRFSFHDDNRVFRQHGHVRCVWYWPQLRWQWHPGGRVLVFCGARVDLDDVKRMRWQHWHVLDG
jgi:hypothetical protein